MSSPPFTSYDELTDFFSRKGHFHMDLALTRIVNVLAELGLARPDYPIVQVVGTNGKGSTSAFLAGYAAAHGLRAGLFASPPVLSERERIRLLTPGHAQTGSLLSHERWVTLANSVLATPTGPELTLFELFTAMAALAFAEGRVDLAVFEAGLGGKNDATRALPAELVLATPIGLDHADVIGPGLADIARDKAGAARPGAPFLSAVQTREVEAVLRAEVPQAGAHLSFLPEHVQLTGLDQITGSRAFVLSETGEAALTVDHFLPAMAGPHQRENAALALAGFRALAERLGLTPSADAVRRALQETRLPGRMELIPARPPQHPPLLLDTAHNAHGLSALALALAALCIRPGSLVFACLKDKDQQRMLPLLPALGLRSMEVFVPALPSPRARDPEELARRIHEGTGLTATPCSSVAEALTLAEEAASRSTLGPEAPVLVCGSTLTVAGALALVPERLIL